MYVWNTYTNIGSEDYIPNAGSLTFSPEDISKNVIVVIRDDNVTEYPERLFLTLSMPSTEGGVVLVEPRRVSITITNDDCEEIYYNNYYSWVKEFFSHCCILCFSG